MNRTDYGAKEVQIAWAWARSSDENTSEVDVVPAERDPVGFQAKVLAPNEVTCHDFAVHDVTCTHKHKI